VFSGCQPGADVIETSTRRISPALGTFHFLTGNVLKKLMIFVVGSYALLMLASLVSAQVSAGKLAAEKCSACHDTARICDNLGRRAPDVWRQTVERMRGNGAQIADADAEAIAEYISTAKPGNKRLCKAAGK
jgi:cytochrome c553